MPQAKTLLSEFSHPFKSAGGAAIVNGRHVSFTIAIALRRHQNPYAPTLSSSSRAFKTRRSRSRKFNALLSRE